MDTASFFSFGIGSSVNDYLIKGIAQSGMGEYFPKRTMGFWAYRMEGAVVAVSYTSKPS